MDQDPAINALREALLVSPENLPLRKHLADSLSRLGRYDEAEAEYRRILSETPDNPACKLGLAHCYAQQDKNSHALVVVEDLIKSPDCPAEAVLLYARLLARAGDLDRAASIYRRAIDQDPQVADLQLARQLGVDEQPARFVESDADEVDSEGRQRAAWEPPPSESVAEVERPKIAFQDVGGMHAVKEQIRLKIIHPLQHPDLYRAYGKTVGGGILLYGPPGCGKTHLARATAGEIKATFISIGINDVLDMWIGNSEKNLHAIFEQARANSPCVLFFDEVDALGASRSDLKHSGGRNLVNQFLSELDGIDSSNDGLLVLAATNAPWQMDAAFRRPGRFDRIIFVPPPDETARAEILRIHCRNKPLDNPDFAQLAKKTPNFSGADLKALLDMAIEAKLQQAMKEGIPRPLTTRDLLAAAGSVKPSTKDWFTTARNYALYSNQSGLYDEVLEYLKLK